MIRINILLVAIVALFTSCTNKADKGKGKTVFRYNEASGISSLDPAFARGQADIWGCNQLYNGLVQMNDELQAVPCIAKSWEISEDGSTYTFHLRNDVFFHDDIAFSGEVGRKVVASDFTFSFNRILDPAVA
nr:ABC transporter substrate-binding protein [Bacteroidia bacterium]